MSIPNLIKFIQANDVVNWRVILIFDFLFVLLSVYIVIKKLIPAFQGKVALELNSTGLTSYTKNVSIEWKEIEDIEQRSGKTSSSLYITFKWETDHGRNIRIPLGFVDGSDSKIYDTVLTYFKRANA